MGNLIKIILVMGVAYWAFTAWNRPSSDTAYPTMSMPTDLKAGHVMVVAAENCTKAAAQQADAITLSLKAKNIPVQRVHRVQFKPQSREDAQQIQKVMQQGPPVVFYAGKAMSQPTWDDVLAMLEQSTEDATEDTTQDNHEK